MYTVYVIMNQYGAVEYIGQTANLKRRMYEHKSRPWFGRSGSLGGGAFYGRNDINVEAVAEFLKEEHLTPEDTTLNLNMTPRDNY